MSGFLLSVFETGYIRPVCKGSHRVTKGKGCVGTACSVKNSCGGCGESTAVYSKTVRTCSLGVLSTLIEKHINDTPDDVKNNSKVIEEIQAKISKLQKRVEGLILMRADGEISKEMYLTQKEQAESEIKALEDKLENLVSNDTPIVEKSSESIAERLTVLKNALNTYAVFDTENDVPDRIVDAFVEKVVVSKDSFDWYLRYAPETAVNCNVEGRKGKANVAFAPNTPFTSSQHRLL